MPKTFNELLMATNRIETIGHNSTNACKGTNENEKRIYQCLSAITKERSNIGEENVNTVLNFLKTTIETSLNETVTNQILPELNKEKINCDHLAKDKGLQALQITITVKETSGIETPRYLTQLIPVLNRTQNVSIDGGLSSKETNGNETSQSLKTLNLRNICNKIKTIKQIPKEIIKIPKKYLTYRAQNTKNSLINNDNEIETELSQGNDGEKETKISKNSRVKLKIPIKSLHNFKNVVNPKGGMNDEEQKEHYEVERFKQIERKNKPMTELLDRAVTKGFNHLREGAKNEEKFDEELPEQIDIEKYGGMLYGLWNAVKKYPLEAYGNITINESKNKRERGENREGNREKEVENEVVLKEKREEKIKTGEKKCEEKEGARNVQQVEMIAKMELENQEMMPEGSQYSNVGRIPKKKFSFRKSLCNYFAKEEKTNVTDAKTREEDCGTEENDSDNHNEMERMTEHFSQMFHI